MSQIGHQVIHLHDISQQIWKYRQNERMPNTLTINIKSIEKRDTPLQLTGNILPTYK